MNSKIKLLGLAAAAALLQATAAHATLLDWSYTAADGTFGGGTFVGDQELGNPGAYDLTSATGSINGHTITGLSGYDGASNVVFPGARFPVDTVGFSVASDADDAFNIYQDAGSFDPDSPFSCGGANFCILGPGSVGPGDPVQALTSLSITIAPVSVPEPATWAMMLVGFGGLGATLRMRRRNAAATA
jgi:hypothetical protein